MALYLIDAFFVINAGPVFRTIIYKNYRHETRTFN